MEGRGNQGRRASVALSPVAPRRWIEQGDAVLVVLGADPACSALWAVWVLTATWSRMRAGGFSNFLEYRFSLHPICPHCSSRRTLRALYGMPAGPPPPWVAAMGCVVEEPQWMCGLCGHQW